MQFCGTAVKYVPKLVVLLPGLPIHPCQFGFIVLPSFYSLLSFLFVFWSCWFMLLAFHIPVRFFIRSPLASLYWVLFFPFPPINLSSVSLCPVPSVLVSHSWCGDTSDLLLLDYQPGMLLIHTLGAVEKSQQSRSYSCVCCTCASVITTVAVGRVEQEVYDKCFLTVSCDVHVPAWRLSPHIFKLLRRHSLICLPKRAWMAKSKGSSTVCGSDRLTCDVDSSGQASS